MGKLFQFGSFFKDRFSKFDIDPKDIPKAIVIHEFLGYTMLALTWTACYHFPLSKSPFIQSKINSVSQMMPKSLTNSMNNIKIPFIDKEVLSSRIGSAYVESSILRKLIRPVVLPTKVFVTYKIVKALSKMEKNKHKLKSIALGKNETLAVPNEFISKSIF